MPVHLWAMAEATTRSKSAGEPEAVGYVVGLTAWLLAAGVFIGFKLAQAEMPPWMYCCIRAALSALVLVPLVSGHYREMARFLSARWLEALVVGAVGLGLTQGVAFTSLKYTTAVNFGIIMAVAPIITMILAIFILREPMNTWQMIGSIIAFCGIIFIAVQGSVAKLVGIDFGFGDVLALVAALLFAGYTIMLKRANFELPRMPLLVILLFGGAIASFPFFALEVWNGEHANMARSGYLALLYAVIPGGALLYLLYNWSIDVLGATRASALFYTQMLFTALLAWLLLGEAIEWYQYAGGGLIVVGILIVTLCKPVSSTGSTA